MRVCLQHPLEGHSETSNDQAVLNPFDHYIKMKAYMRIEGRDTLPWGRLSPPPPFDHYIKMKVNMRVEGGGDTLPRGRLSPTPHHRQILTMFTETR